MKRSRYSAAVESNRNIGAFKYIRCTCYNLNRLFLTYIKLAYYKFVSVRVFVYLNYFAHYDLDHVFSHFFHSLKVGA